MLGLKPGASHQAAERAFDRLHKKLLQRRLRANVDIADGNDGDFFVCIDIRQAVAESAIPVRRLKAPRRIFMSSDKPLQLLEQLEARRHKLLEEGRPAEPVYRDGVKYYNDEPCNRIIKQMLLQVPPLRGECLALVASDPDPSRRAAGIELLNWAGAPVADCAAVAPAINDADADVRVAAAKYVISRIDLLSDRFNWNKLLEAYSFQLSRPSHRDRLVALACLQQCAQKRPDLRYNIKVLAGERLALLAERSIVPVIADNARKLLALVADAKAPPPRRRPPVLDSF